MALILLIIIYITFISLGLPDSLLGSAWPIMQADLKVPLSNAGLLSMITTGGTVVSSLLGGKLIRLLGTGKLTFISVAMTAAALLGFSLSPSFLWLMACAIPLGLGAGAVDTALNNFIALHYKARHMNWLHCFWGIGATAGPLIMSVFISRDANWRGGYSAISVIQFSLVLILAFALPLWKKFESPADDNPEQTDRRNRKGVLSIPGVKASLTAFFAYSAVELGAGLWGTTYLTLYKGLPPDTAARAFALYYAGITAGRFVSGFVTMAMDNRRLIRLGQWVILTGILVILLPLPPFFSITGFVLLGIGCAPLFPSMLHETPARFGPGASQTIMGIQMAAGYTGSTLMPMALGFILSKAGVQILPYYLLFFLVLLIGCSEYINRLMAKSGSGTSAA
ncbi:MFS transporter [Breznakiella homolactica]|uniref:MFS transporter n=1 Tax=Breznakiella homolactica TaxID=2798577 RepID=A0A7T7XMU5_9SPIR|nr:MFS transporter [Breznakiella homolactica]QQO09188.1 MFS transporter [Breznakiella homolactica]